MLAEAIDDLELNKPKLVLLQKYSENDIFRKDIPLEYTRYRRYHPMYNWITIRNHSIGYAGDVQLFAPGKQ